MSIFVTLSKPAPTSTYPRATSAPHRVARDTWSPLPSILPQKPPPPAATPNTTIGAPAAIVVAGGSWRAMAVSSSPIRAAASSKMGAAGAAVCESARSSAGAWRRVAARSRHRRTWRRDAFRHNLDAHHPRLVRLAHDELHSAHVHRRAHRGYTAGAADDEPSQRLELAVCRESLAERLRDIRERHRRVGDHVTVAKRLDLRVDVVLVADVTDDLLDDVFERDEASRPPELVADDRDMHPA